MLLTIGSQGDKVLGVQSRFWWKQASSKGAISRVVRVRTGSGEQHVSCSLSLTTAHDTQNTAPSVLSRPRALRIDTSTLNSAHKEQ